MLILHDVELFVVHDVRPRFACADAVQLKPKQVCHLYWKQLELLPHLAPRSAVDDNLFHSYLPNTLSNALSNERGSKQLR